MILILLVIFIIYFIAKVFIYSDYFFKLDGLDKILFICLLNPKILGILLKIGNFTKLSLYEIKNKTSLSAYL